jgi:hypothetical protein
MLMLSGKGGRADMKRNFMIAMGIGFLISTVLMAVPSTNGWAFLEFPGMGAAYLLPNSVIVGTSIGWAVNAVVYSLVALAVLSILKISN